MTTTMTRPERSYNRSSSRQQDKYATRDMTTKAIVNEDDSVIINPRNMNLDEFYTAIINEKLFLYKKTSDTEVEVYELDRQV